MDNSPITPLDFPMPAGYRNPLLPKSMSPPSTPLKNVRRKGSFCRRGDSDEVSPFSSNSSIFEAFLLSSSNSDESSSKLDTGPRINQPIFNTTRPNNENMRQPSSSSRSDTIPTVPENEFLYGHGTVLDTISEKKSNPTIRSVARPKSADEILTTPLLGHRDSFTLNNKSPRRKHSFSLDDIWSIKDSYHEACAMIDRVARRRLSIHEVYAQPKEPLLAPPERPSTPPGCPSWTDAQRPGLRGQSAPQQSRLQRMLKIPSSSLALSIRSSSSGFSLSRRTVSAPAGPQRLPPRFRVPKSVYSTIDSHPFSRAAVHKIDSEPSTEPPRLISSSANQPQISRVPVSASAITAADKGKGKGKAKLVRFTPSATARDSEMANLRNAMEATSSTAFHPLSSELAEPGDNIAFTTGCPHRRGQPVFKSLNAESTVPPSNDYLPLASMSSINSLLQFDRSLQNPDSLQMTILDRDPTSTISTPSICTSLASGHYITTFEDGNDNDEDVDIGLTEADVNGAPLANTTSVCSSNTYMMSGALSVATTSEAAIQVPIMTGAQLMTIQRQDENDRRQENAGKGMDADDKCWRCRLEGMKSKIDGWWGRGGDWACFICCAGESESWDMDVHGDGEVEAARRRRTAVLAGVPAVGM